MWQYISVISTLKKKFVKWTLLITVWKSTRKSDHAHKTSVKLTRYLVTFLVKCWFDGKNVHFTVKIVIVFYATFPNCHTVLATKYKCPENKDLSILDFTVKFNVFNNYILKRPQISHWSRNSSNSRLRIACQTWAKFAFMVKMIDFTKERGLDFELWLPNPRFSAAKRRFM